MREYFVEEFFPYDACITLNPCATRTFLCSWWVNEENFCSVEICILVCFKRASQSDGLFSLFKKIVVHDRKLLLPSLDQSVEQKSSNCGV